MASTTTNYGWTVPTSSDLVKNGATAISTVGQSVDTFLFRPFTRNAVLNSGFQVAQRGTSVAVNAALAYSLDRWNSYYAGNLTISRQATGDTTNLPFIQYCARFQRNAGQTNTTGTNFSQSIETINSIPFVGKTVTFSFYARKGANYSPTSDVLTYAVVSGTGTDQSYLSSWSGSSNVVFANATLTTTWQRFTATGTVSSSATQLAINFSNTPTGTAGAADYYEVTGVMLEVGSQASPYTPATPTYATELAACQRYYYRAGGASTYEAFANGQATSTTVAKCLLRLPVTMRVSPTSIEYSTVGVADGYSAPISAVVTLGAASPNVQEMAGTVSSGLTQNRAYYLSANNSTSAYIGVSAEL